VKKPKVILLAGGKGTRLGSLTQAYPKPMLKVAGKPWLIYLINELKRQGLADFHISVGFEHEKLIRDLDPWLPPDVNVTYHLDEPLSGTGGAIYQVAGSIQGPVLVLNGDSYVADFSVNKLIDEYLLSGAHIQLAAVAIDDVKRFGCLTIEDNRVVEFNGKGGRLGGEINAGIYLFDFCDLKTVNAKIFSFEEVSLIYAMQRKQLYATRFAGPFIDIGVPRDLLLAEKFEWSE
jgi:D-glycero-alpha-D-manno-heptose 1-phosphate guanylyltransferase